jgi:hypothetical protein
VAMRKVACFLSCVLAASLTCSTETPAFHPTVSGGARLSQLPLLDLQIICVEQLQYFGTQEQSPVGHEALCRQSGRDAAFRTFVPSSTDADVRQACQSAHDACALNAPVVPDAAADAAACSPAIMPQMSCTATVDQYAACVTALVSSWTKPGQPCDTLTVAAIMNPPQPDAGTPSLPPACVTLGAACPDLTQVFLGPGNVM